MELAGREELFRSARHPLYTDVVRGRFRSPIPGARSRGTSEHAGERSAVTAPAPIRVACLRNHAAAGHHGEGALPKCRRWSRLPGNTRSHAGGGARSRAPRDPVR